MQDYITQSIQEGIRLKENILNNRQMLADIETVGNLIVQALRQGHKVLLCGNGGSAADAQHIAAEVFERQTAALGTKGDILIGLSTSGNSPNVEHALQKAQSMGITTIGLLGRDGGRCKELCNYPLIIQHAESARIQEVHITIGHILCGIVDNKLFSHE